MALAGLASKYFPPCRLLALDILIPVTCYVWTAQEGELLGTQGRGQLCNLVSIGGLGLRQVVRPLLERWLDEVSWPPQVGGEVAIGGTESLKSGLHEVALGAGVPTRGCEAVSNLDPTQMNAAT